MAEVMVETSARHVHLSKEHIEILFGKGAELTKKESFLNPGSLPARRESMWWARKNLSRM